LFRDCVVFFQVPRVRVEKKEKERKKKDKKEGNICFLKTGSEH